MTLQNLIQHFRKTADHQNEQNLELSDNFRCHLSVCLYDDTGQMGWVGGGERQVIQSRLFYKTDVYEINEIRFGIHSCFMRQIRFHSADVRRCLALQSALLDRRRECVFHPHKKQKNWLYKNRRFWGYDAVYIGILLLTFGEIFLFLVHSVDECSMPFRIVSKHIPNQTVSQPTLLQ